MVLRVLAWSDLQKGVEGMGLALSQWGDENSPSPFSGPEFV